MLKVFVRHFTIVCLPIPCYPRITNDFNFHCYCWMICLTSSSLRNRGLSLIWVSYFYWFLFDETFTWVHFKILDVEGLLIIYYNTFGLYFSVHDLNFELCRNFIKIWGKDNPIQLYIFYNKSERGLLFWINVLTYYY